MGKVDIQPVQIPTAIKLHNKPRCLEVNYANGDSYKLPCEYLWGFSPTAQEKE